MGGASSSSDLQLAVNRILQCDDEMVTFASLCSNPFKILLVCKIHSVHSKPVTQVHLLSPNLHVICTEDLSGILFLCLSFLSKMHVQFNGSVFAARLSCSALHNVRGS